MGSFCFYQLRARIGSPGHEVCHSPESHSVLWGVSMTLSPWGNLFGALPPWHCCLSRAVTVGEVKPNKTSWGRITLLLYPACVSLGNWIQDSLLLCGVTRQFMGTAEHSSAQLQWALAQGHSRWPIFSEQWQQTLDVLRTWKDHRILADDLIDHTPSLPPCRLHFHT